MTYIVAIIFGVIIGTGIGTFIVKKAKRPLYQKKMPKGSYEKEFYGTLLNAYDTTGNIRSMLQLLLQSKYTKGIASVRISAALDYLNHSRYKDYETAISYLSDGTAECEEVLHTILGKEVRKINGLIMKEFSYKEERKEGGCEYLQKK